MLHKPGKRFGEYELLEPLGEGSFGEVWLARKEDTTIMANRRFALKLLAARIERDDLLREVALWQRANDHLHIVPFIEGFVSNGTALIVSEFRSRGSLHRWLVNQGGRARSHDAAVAITRGILNALDHLRKIDVVHRDIKPSNVLLHNDDVPQLADFGIARRCLAGTPDYRVMGTPDYMSPEAWRPNPDFAVDLWAVGVMLYQMLTGKLPFQGEEAIKDPFVRMPPLEIEVPGWLEKALERALDKDIRNRFQTAQDFREGLEVAKPRFSEAHKRRVLETYRSYWLDQCKRVELRNLPERDRRIPSKHISLEQLYVPLRVYLGGAEGADPGDSEILDILDVQRASRLGAHTALQGVLLGHRLRKESRLVVLGRSGAGKSTLVNFITSYYLHRWEGDYEDLPDDTGLPSHNWHPILIRCRDLGRDSLSISLDKVLRRTMRRSTLTAEDLDALSEALQHLLSHGEAILLVDGLDEIADVAERRQFSKLLEQLATSRQFEKSPIIVTSRIVGYREMEYGLRPAFEHAVVADLTREDKDKFAELWSAAVEPPERQASATRELKQAIHSNPHIEHLTSNPLLLTTLALVKRHFNKLPRNRAELFCEFVDVLLKWGNDVHVPIEKKEALPQVEFLAYGMCERGVRDLREDEILHLLELLRLEFPGLRPVKRRTPEQFLELLLQSAGVLDQVGEITHNGARIPVYQFRHPALQEYLAGQALVNGHYPKNGNSRSLARHVAELVHDQIKAGSPPGSSSDASDRVLSELWCEALRLCVCCTGVNEAEEVLTSILTPLDHEGTRHRVVLASLCLADEPKVADAMAERVLRELVGAIEASDGQGGQTPTSVDLAVLEVGRSEDFRELLHRLLIEAFQARPAKLRDSCAVLYALSLYETAPSGAQELGRWLDQRVEVLQRGDDLARIAACLEIMEVGYRGRLNARHGLIEGLLPLLSGEPALAHAAAWALDYLRVKVDNRLILWKAPPDLWPQLVQFLRQPGFDLGAAMHLSRLLGRSAAPDAVPVLLPLLGKPGLTPYFYKMIGQALYQIGEPSIEPLLGWLRANMENGHIRYCALTVLEALDPDRKRLRWVDFYDDTSESIRCKALGAEIVHAGLSEDERRLLSRNFDGKPPWTDPSKIDEARVKVASRALELPPHQVRQGYRALGKKFPRLQLNLTSDGG